MVGHRGVRRAGVVENTLEALAAAHAEGADWLELDARRSADGPLVLYHNGWTPDGVPVVERTAGELGALGLCTLAAALDWLPDGVGVDVEVKNLFGEPDYDEQDTIVADIATLLGPHVGRRPLLTSSFNPVTVATLTAALPDVPCGLIHFDSLSLPSAVALAVEQGARVVAPQSTSVGLDADGIATAHAAGLAVMPWTVNEPAEAQRLADAGVDALCTDDPATVKAALSATPRA
ncbi:MAG TPA: glycerophosphodiester phosphodiesterase [Egibacteraceae bacterium]|nr:glycerophosphodiester phosphodiesterase [Egibacteraceae bacterium]